jgi:hypothetical protein
VVKLTTRQRADQLGAEQRDRFGVIARAQGFVVSHAWSFAPPG